MGTPGKLTLSVDEMIQKEKEKRGKRQYMTNKSGLENVEYRSNRIKELIGSSMEQLAQTITRSIANLEDTPDIEQRIIAYMKVCQHVGTIPTQTGLALSLGYTDRSLMLWRQKHFDHPTGKLLERFADLSAEIVDQSNMRGDVQVPAAIFHLKNKHGWKDQSELSIAPVEKEKPVYSIEDIRKQYLPAENLIECGTTSGITYTDDLEGSELDD